jgi:uncharacterized surface protein with fasciclin (FAS1) repeats
MTRRFPRRSGAVAVALVAAIGLAACGSESDSPTETTAAAATETTAAASTETSAAAAEGKDIVQTAVDAGSFTTLATLLTEAGLVETLKGDGPFTVFAPTDEAFAKVPAETLEALKADKAMLAKVLTYHVVAGKVMAADIKPGDVATVEGQNITLAVDGASVKVNDATVTAADIDTTNGVIHVIDTVLLPPA